ncbi:hypothetical protein [Glutamicibacter sp. NPDC087344]|uniref:hypothetical protein n=1 Tax=Glutamicibacter sp. NPDC087344 TaxID=3363994 RepID=UPI00382B8DF1
MRELLGRLTALDPEAGEALKVISYFDALTARGVGIGGLLRASAVLSGTTAGAELSGRSTAYGPDGKRVTLTPGASSRLLQRFDGGTVWLDRLGPAHANDALLLERLALAIEAVEASGTQPHEMETIIDAHSPLDERLAALARLRISPSEQLRLVASSQRFEASSSLTGLIPTTYGNLYIKLELRRLAARESHPAHPLPQAGPGDSEQQRMGFGTWVRADGAPESWEAAVIAYRLLGDGEQRVLDATELGAMLILARAYDPAKPHADVLAVANLDPVSQKILRALVDADSIRAAAAKLSMHHSTLQSRHESLSTQLGYDPRSNMGRMRYTTAELLYRLGE